MNQQEIMKHVNTKKAKAEFEARKALDKDDINKLFGAKREEAERMANGGVNYALMNYIMTVHSFEHCGTAMDAMRLMYSLCMVQVNRLSQDAKLMASCFTEEQLKELEIDPAKLDLQVNAVNEMEKYKTELKKRKKLKDYGIEAKKRGLIKH